MQCRADPPVLPLDVDVSDEQDVHHEGDEGHHHGDGAAEARRHVLHEQGHHTPEANHRDALPLSSLMKGVIGVACARKTWGNIRCQLSTETCVCGRENVSPKFKNGINNIHKGNGPPYV